MPKLLRMTRNTANVPHITYMKRRTFIKNATALAAVPMLPVRALAGAPVIATAVPNGARFWAIYMSTMHGTCSAKTLSNMTGLDMSAARNCLSKLISDGVITPTRIMSNIAKSQANRPDEPSKWRERVKKFMDEKQPTEQQLDMVSETDEIEDEEIDQDNNA